MQSRSAASVHTSNAAAQRAVDFALAQVGKPYVWAAAGPDSYDCSGLTMAAWARGGVALPHFAAAQYRYGTHVPYSDLHRAIWYFSIATCTTSKSTLAKGLPCPHRNPAKT